MRILMLSQNRAGVGGTFGRAFSLARALVLRGHDVTLMAASLKRRLRVAEEARAGVRLLQMPGVAMDRVRHAGLDVLDIASRLAVFADLSNNAFDVIHTFDHRPAVRWPARMLRRRAGTPIVADWCDLWGGEGLAATRSTIERILLGPLDTYWEQRLSRSADRVTVISRHLRDRALAQGIPGDHIHWLPIGASVDLIRPQAQAAARRSLGVPADARVVVYSGFTGLGVRLLAGTFAALGALDPSAFLLLAGGSFPELDHMLAQAGLADRVLSLGQLPYERLGEALACGDVMLLPNPDHPFSRAGFPSKLGDYMAAGRPVVTNAVGEAADLVASEEIGLLADEDPAVMAIAVKRLFDDAPLRDEMGSRARRVAETQYAWHRLAAQLEIVYADAAR